MDQGSFWENLTWVEIAVPIVFLCFIIFTVVCLIFQCKRNQKMARSQREILAQQLSLAEQEGVEIPDDLKKGTRRQRRQQMKMQMAEDLEGNRNTDISHQIDDTKKPVKGRHARRKNKDKGDADMVQDSESKMPLDFFYKDHSPKINKVVPTSAVTPKSKEDEVHQI